MTEFLGVSYKFSLFILCCLIFASKCDKCVPGEVASLNFTTDYQLNWPEASNPNNCTITSYVIYLRDIDEGTIQLYETTATVNNTYDFSDLEMCSLYSFEVSAKTDEDVIGNSQAFSYTTAPKSDLDLNVTMDSEITLGNTISIAWEMEESNATKCVSYYRLVIWNDTNDPTDIYLKTTNYTISDIIPCMTYEFQVRAILINPEIEGPFSLAKQAAIGSPTTAPKLQSIRTTATTATLVWQLESYEQNKCEVKALVIETVSKSTITLNITDGPDRDLVTVTLDDLKPNTVYVSEVYVANSSGNSTKVSITYQTADNSTVPVANNSLWTMLKNIF